MNDAHTNVAAGNNLAKKNDERERALSHLASLKKLEKSRPPRYRLRLDGAYISCTDPTLWLEAGAELIEVRQDDGKRGRGRPRKIK